MAKEEKLEWIYKGANSLVDREEYLLGRKVDKTLEQINEEEKEKKFVLPTPKNHVEHECIPPSIRDFNKIVQAEQVDLSAKLQEDPLVAIKKKEEEARRQFLQNPIQLKKLQEALKSQQDKKKHKKSKRKHSDAELNNKILMKLKLLRDSPTTTTSVSKKEKKKNEEGALDTILMHKFNALKEKLSDKDLNDILSGKICKSSDEESDARGHHSSSSEKETIRGEDRGKNKLRTLHYNESDQESNTSRSRDKRNFTKRSRRSDSANSDVDKKNTSLNDKYHNSRRRNSASDRDRSRSKDRKDGRSRDDKKSHHESGSGKKEYRKNKHRSGSKVDEDGGKSKNSKKERSRNSSTSSDDELDTQIMSKLRNIKNRDHDEKYRKNKYRPGSKADEDGGKSKNNKKKERSRSSSTSSGDELDTRIMSKLRNIKDKDHETNDNRKDLDSFITEKLKALRGETEAETSKKHLLPNRPSHLKGINSSNSSSSSSEDDSNGKKQSFGLVTSQGKKLKLKYEETKRVESKRNKPIEQPNKQEKRPKFVKNLTDQEKEKLRKEMMLNAQVRDTDREANVRRYREKDKREEELCSSKYDKNFIHKELVKSTKETVEERIKSNLNNIQRSTSHMNVNFSKR